MAEEYDTQIDWKLVCRELVRTAYQRKHLRWILSRCLSRIFNASSVTVELAVDGGSRFFDVEIWMSPADFPSECSDYKTESQQICDFVVSLKIDGTGVAIRSARVNVESMGHRYVGDSE